MRASPDGNYEGAAALAGVAALARDFDGFILDQWGVLHDGTQAYAGAIECLEQLRRAGKQVVILSNSGRRESGNIQLMEKIGFRGALFDRVVSAGEDARRSLELRDHAFHARLGWRYFAFTRDDDVSLLDGLGLERVGCIAQADFLMLIGIDSPRMTLRDYQPLLEEGAATRLPMICANPDVTRPSPDGPVDAPGALARAYEALGGEVFYHGKPYPAIYATCLEALSRCARERVVAVGDSMEHDIAGAAGVGVKSALVAGGIHAEDLGIARGALPDADAWRRFMAGVAARPDYVIPAFVW